MDPMEVEITSQLVTNEKITNQLKRCFEKKLDHEIIEIVAYECGYDIEKATTNLLDMAKQVSFPVSVDFTDKKSVTSAPNIPEGTRFPPVATSSSAQPIPHVPMEIRSSLEVTTVTNSPKLRALSKADINPVSVVPKSSAELNIERLITDGKRGIKLMVLMRGLPGSGKSFLANRIVQESIGPCDSKNYVLSSDDYFYRNGAYDYDSRFVPDAHKWNQTRAFKLITSGVSPIIIDNTNTQCWEMKPYCIWAVQNSYAIEILEPNTPWAFKEAELARRNSHNVPRLKIRDMLDRYEKGITVRILFQRFELAYMRKLPPQPRSYPSMNMNQNPNGTDDNTLGADVSMSPPQNVAGGENTGAAESLLNTWGLTEESLRSWNVVEKIEGDSKCETFPHKKEHAAVKRQYRDCGTMTSLANPFTLLCTKILNTNPDSFNSSVIFPIIQPKDGSFEKSTMTDIVDEKLDDAVECLQRLFENIPEEYLRDVYEKCQCDIQWTIEILLSDSQDIIEGYSPPTRTKKIQKTECPKVNPEKCEDEVKKAKKTTSEKAAEIKHFIESNVHISNEHYSDHILKLKKVEIKDEDPKPCTSKSETVMTDAGEVILIDSDLEFDDLDDDVIMLSDDSDAQDTMELRLGDEFISQLEHEFGNENLCFGQGFQPIIEVPKALGRQLHALYLESIFKQMDMQSLVLESMIAEDEAFAKKLQEQEFRTFEVEETPDLKQIMTEQIDENRQKKVIDQWKNLTPDDFAYRLTKQKLIACFPEVDADTLIEILAAHNNCYQQTVVVLLESGVNQTCDVTKIKQAPLSDEMLSEIREAHQSTAQSEKIHQDKSASVLREVAYQYQNNRRELLEKANSYYGRRMYEIAMFYSDLASQQTAHCEKLNNMAAEQFLSESFDRLQSYNTIDLHHLHVKEALVALDRFLDNAIMLLNEENTENQSYLHIITGRGKNSPGGKPKIRPAVMQRLKKRGLRFEMVNAGLLRAKILKNSVMTTSMA